ncbi:DUF2326 domain-containing protein [Boudabousia marimammalium]|uniref:DUF2326 domain-containing protein n=1 Tax=Boudabousia marimammalium TaxID=156892 RepID=UPI000A7E7B0E|nr:ABC-three component system middle component 7 [Boudabousia marimammalium]
MIRLPNKLYRFNESVLADFVTILKAVNNYPISILELHRVPAPDLHTKDFIDALTLLQIIDFVYSGNDFLKSEAVLFPQTVGHHTIYVTLHFDGKDHHFSRATNQHGFVTRYNDPAWKYAEEELDIDDYQSFLLEHYALQQTGGTWCELVGRFSRVDGRNMALLDRPLTAAAGANDTDGAKAQLDLFGVYDEIERIQSRYGQVNKEASMLNAMAKGKYSSYIKFTTKRERNAAQRELIEAQSEAKQLRTHVDLDLFQAKRKARQEQVLKRAQTRPLVQEFDAINSHLAIVEATLSGKTLITTRYLGEFHKFFPDANRKPLETIEYYHHQFAGILEEQLLEQQRCHPSQAAALMLAIDNLKGQILALGESVSLDDETYGQSTRVQARISRLDEQSRAFDRNEELKAESKKLKQDIAEVIPSLLGNLTDTINAQIKTTNDVLYPNQHRKSPQFSFKAATKSVSYSFPHNGDRGSGSKVKNLIIFDLAALTTTPLPFVIHDSAMIKSVTFAQVRELLNVYAQTRTLTSGAHESKQVFFSFDATKACGMGTEHTWPKTRSFTSVKTPKHSTDSRGTPRQK